MTVGQSPFGDCAFTVSQGAAAGLGRGAMAGKRFDRPFHGVRRRADFDDALHQPTGDRDRDWRSQTPEATIRIRRECQTYAVRLRPGQFYSHDTCLALIGAPVPRSWQPVIHVSAYRPASAPRVAGVVGHRLQMRDAAGWRCGPLPIEHPARALFQASRHWTADDVIAAADFLVLERRKLMTLDELRQEAHLVRGAVLDDVLDQVRVGAESPEETRLRLTLLRAGFPEPVLQRELYTASGDFVARFDQSYPRYRVSVEYDGRGHAFDAEQFARDADRWDAIREEGWDHVRVLGHHIRDNGAAAVGKVRRALLRAGWRPGE